MRKQIKIVLILCFLGLLLNVNAQTIITPDNSKISYIGRFEKSDLTQPKIGWSGATIHFKFTGKVVKVKMSSTGSQNYYYCIVDEEKPFKIHLSNFSKVYTIADNLSDGEHEVKLIRLTEGALGTDTFREIILDDDESLVDLPVNTKKMIEFYGNSITCGYGNETTNTSDGFKPEQENFYKTYASYASRILNANCIGIAKSGWGMYQDRNGIKNNILLKLYDKNTFRGSSKWDFTDYTADLVCINLGTNDIAYSSFDKTIFKDSCKLMMQKLRIKYPDAYIVFVTGSMLTGSKLAKIIAAGETAVSEINDPKISIFNMSQQTGKFQFGGHFHPTVAQHRYNGLELAEYLKELTQWDSAPFPLDAKVAKDGMSIIVKLSEAIKNSNKYEGFKVSINSQLVDNQSVTKSEVDDNTIIIHQKERIRAGNKVYINYQYGNIQSNTPISMYPFFDFKATNKVKETTVTLAKTNTDGNKISVSFNKAITLANKQGFNVYINQELKNIISGVEKGEKSNSVDINLNEAIKATDAITIDVNFKTVKGLHDSIPNDKKSGKSVFNNSVISSINTIGKQQYINVYPNPITDNVLRVSFNENNGNTRTITLFNIAGEIVFKTDSNSKELNINMKELPKGMYALTVKDNDFTYSKKVIHK